MVISFLWGVLMFKEKLASLPGSVGGLGLLVVGIGGAAMCQSELPNRIARSCTFVDAAYDCCTAFFVSFFSRIFLTAYLAVLPMQ